jgi:hypothetical protein
MARHPDYNTVRHSTQKFHNLKQRRRRMCRRGDNMTDNARMQAAIDRVEIMQVSNTLLSARDDAEWEKLAQCFHADAHVKTSWFDGTAQEFAEAARKMMEGHHETDTQRHTISNQRVTINAHRAVNEYYLMLYQGRTLDGYEFDFVTWSVTLDLFENRNGEWRISKRSNIYEKDRMDPHVPGSVPYSYYQGLDLSRYPSAIRFHCYRNERSSGHPPKNLILKGSPEEKAACQEAADWLAGLPLKRK